MNNSIPDYSVCGVLVQTQPSLIQEVSGHLEQMDGVDVHASAAEGKLVVTVESDKDSTNIIDRLTALQQIPGILSASLVYSQQSFEPDTDNNSEDLV